MILMVIRDRSRMGSTPLLVEAVSRAGLEPRDLWVNPGFITFRQLTVWNCLQWQLPVARSESRLAKRPHVPTIS